MSAQRSTALQGLGERVPVARAAKLIGCSDDHIRALIECGELDAVDISLPTASRVWWSVDVGSIRAYLDRRKTGHEKSPNVAGAADGVEGRR